MHINLRKNCFTEKERVLVDFDELKASLFLYESGVHAVRVSNSKGHIIVLPFKGQQIWDAVFCGRRLTMKSLFTEPKDTDHFVNTYGCFLMHCGALRMGCAGPEDNHPNHGELPYADYNRAWLSAGQDERGNYIGVGGMYEHSQAFADKYHARPLVKLYENSSLIDVSMTIENQSNYPMELMYLCHVNYRPVDNGKIVQTAGWTSKDMQLRETVPSHVSGSESFIKQLAELKENPKLTEIMRPQDSYDPEVVFFINSPKTDNAGLAYFMQVHPDGSADYVAYKPEQFDHNTRWIAKRKNEEALGFAMPATCDPEGYTAEKKKGNIKQIPAKGQVHFSVVTGYLKTDEAESITKKIQEIVA